MNKVEFGYLYKKDIHTVNKCTKLSLLSELSNWLCSLFITTFIFITLTRIFSVIFKYLKSDFSFHINFWSMQSYFFLKLLLKKNPAICIKDLYSNFASARNYYFLIWVNYQTDYIHYLLLLRLLLLLSHLVFPWNLNIWTRFWHFIKTFLSYNQACLHIIFLWQISAMTYNTSIILNSTALKINLFQIILT